MHTSLFTGRRVSGGSRTRLSDAAGRCLGCSATDTQARAEGVEPSACGLEPHCSPRSTPLSVERTDQESNLNGRDARLSQGPMTGAPGRTPTLSGNSGGWGRASGLLLFGETLLPPELHRKQSETPAGVEPASRSGCSRPPEPPGPTSLSNKSRRWDSNPLRPRYEGGARPVEHRRPIRAASAGVEPTRPRFKASVPSRGPGHKPIQRSGGTRTRTRPFTGGVLDRSSCTGVVGQGWIAGYDPAPRRSRGRMQPLHHTHHRWSALRPVSP